MIFIGFKGKICGENIDDCSLFFCGIGFCIDGIDNFICNCIGFGYIGVMCNKDINECEIEKFCYFNVICINYKGIY